MITKFISANPVLAALIAVAVIAIIYYLVKKAKGQTNSPNNLAVPSTPTTNVNSPDLVQPSGVFASDQVVSNYNDNAAKIADMGAKSARNTPVGNH